MTDTVLALGPPPLVERIGLLGKLFQPGVFPESCLYRVAGKSARLADDAKLLGRRWRCFGLRNEQHPACYFEIQFTVLNLAEGLQ